jgi:hypothetical protein
MSKPNATKRDLIRKQLWTRVEEQRQRTEEFETRKEFKAMVKTIVERERGDDFDLIAQVDSGWTEGKTGRAMTINWSRPKK